MLAFRLVTYFCAAFLLAIVAVVAYRTVTLPRPDRIAYVRNFKKGKCAIVYVVAVPLFLINNLHVGKTFFEALLDGISKAIYLIALKYDTSSVAALAGVLPEFRVTVYVCLAIVILNALMFAFSVFHQSVWEVLSRRAFVHGGGTKCIVIGATAAGRAIYKSCPTKKMIVGDLSAAEREKLFIANVTYRPFVKGKPVLDWFLSDVDRLATALRGTHERINIIIAEEDEKRKLYLAGRFVEYMKRRGEAVVGNVEVYVFGNREYEDIYSRYEREAMGCLHYVNEYRQVAVDFVDRYPLTAFMTPAHLDTETSLLTPAAEVTVAMIGFGRTNQQVFLSMVANNQLMTEGPTGAAVPARVSYHLFDRLHTGGHKNLNHNYFRYKHTFFSADGTPSVGEDEYLPLPPMPAEETYHYFDINDKSFYEDLRAVIGRGPSAISYIIVSLGADYASIDIANKISAKLSEWGADNCHVFVRVKDKDVLRDASVCLDTSRCHPFGTEAETAYEYSRVVRERLSEMAIMRHFAYDVERDVKRGPVTAEEMEASRRRFYTSLSPLERESNLYACLSLRQKLQMMGLDYTEKTVADRLREATARREALAAATPEDTAALTAAVLEERRLSEAYEALPAEEREDGRTPLSAEEYMAHYARDDRPVFTGGENGAPTAIAYPLEPTPSRRTTMAMQEHSRWNAYMILQGFVPATREAILSERRADGRYTNGKTYEGRRHGNLTSFEGLREFRRIVAERDGVPELERDVIKYDYQLLDGAFWLLDENGYKIYKR
ncbi:MAG: hypothetical protein IKC73_03095 [Clostridia bacterium]|nr:hypothetical protein [Clostridia bacterium]